MIRSGRAGWYLIRDGGVFKVENFMEVILFNAVRT
jgi:hypothetical protein